jgi:hypothetical protein
MQRRPRAIERQLACTESAAYAMTSEAYVKTTRHLIEIWLALPKLTGHIELRTRLGTSQTELVLVPTDA